MKQINKNKYYIRHNRDNDYYAIIGSIDDLISDDTWEHHPLVVTRYDVEILYTNHNLSKLYPDSYYTGIFCFEIKRGDFAVIEKKQAKKEIEFLKLLYE